MKIEYVLTEDDFLTHQLYSASQSPQVRRKRRRSQLILPVLYLLFAAVLGWEQRYEFAAVILGIALIWYFLYPVYTRYAYRRHYRSYIRQNYGRNNGKMLTLMLEREQFTASQEGLSNRIETTQLERIDEIPQALYVRLKTGPSFIFPKHRIAEIEALISFLKELSVSLGIPYTEHHDWKWR